MELIVIPQKDGLTVNFLNQTKVPSNITYEWDFGDDSEKSTVKSPTHVYAMPGFYNVTLKTNQEGSELNLDIVISNKVDTTLNGSIYHLIDGYLPVNIINKFPFHKKQMYIEKWQLYIQPLVERELGKEISINNYNNELYYEALENQLIMEASMLDFLTMEFTSLLQSVSTLNESGTNATEEGIKMIKTGPSEVEYFNPNEHIKDTILSITKAMSPGGYIETLRFNLCTLSARVMIFLPFCELGEYNTIVPRVVNRREPTRYDGPNPPYPVSKGR